MKGAYAGRLKKAKVPGTTSPWPLSGRKKRLSLVDLDVMQIPEATNYDYDDDDEIMDPVELIREFKRHPQFCDELRRLTEDAIPDDLTPEERADLGAPGMAGRWDLIYLAFVASRDPAPWSFRRRWRSSPIWQECGSESGMRKYEGKDSWLGGLGGGFIDVLTGVGIAVDAIRADDAEFNHYDDLFNDLVESTDELPVAVSIDKGNAVRNFYEYNTRRGIGTVGPRRIYKGKKTGPDWRTELYDEHGHPRCPNCNGPGLMDRAKLGWYRDPNTGEPRLRFYCATPYEDDCKGTHSIPCSEEWLLLQPLTITHPIFQALRHLHDNLERVWGHYRQRYCFAGKDTTSRLKRLGVSPQRLRGNAAILIDWFRVMLRHGWLGSWKTQNSAAPEVRGAPVEKLQKLEDIRRARGLDVPYGKRWERLKERIRKRRRNPHAHQGAPPGTAPPIPAKPPDPPPQASGEAPKIWLPPDDLGCK